MPKGKRASAAEGRPADYRPQTRTCLSIGCGKAFFSLGPGNRKCPACTRKANERRG